MAGGWIGTYLEYNLESPLGCHEDIAEEKIENVRRRNLKESGEKREERNEEKKERKGFTTNALHCNTDEARAAGVEGQEKKKVCDKESIASAMQQRDPRALCRDDGRRLHGKASRGRTRIDHRLAGSFLMPASVDRRDMRVCAWCMCECVCGPANMCAWMSSCVCVAWRGVCLSVLYFVCLGRGCNDTSMGTTGRLAEDWRRGGFDTN